jgi:hypothetical protein
LSVIYVDNIILPTIYQGMTAVATEMAYAAGLQVILEYDRYCAVGNRKKVLAWSAHLDAKAYSHVILHIYEDSLHNALSLHFLE